jgi:hypothetical protein
LSSLSHQGTPDTSNDASIGTSVAEKRKKGPSEYELEREANIAENRQLLASLGLLEAGSSLFDKSSSKVKRKKREKGKRYAFGLFGAYPTTIQNFFRKPMADGVTIDQAGPSPVSPPLIQPPATASASNDNSPALTPEGDGISGGDGIPEGDGTSEGDSTPGGKDTSEGDGTPGGDGSSAIIFTIFLLVIDCCASLAGPMDISRNSSSTTSDNILIDLPLATTADKAMKMIFPFLRKLSDEKWWTGLLAAWIKFEAIGPPKSVSFF